MVSVDEAADVYVWGYPLVVMHRTRALHCSGKGIGVLNHRENLATPASRTVVAPNNDTLYSSGWFDLRAGDVTVAVPPLDRNWSVMALDAYTYVTCGSRRLHGTDGVSLRFTYDPAAAWPRTATTEMAVGTPTVWILIRVMVAGPDDLATARSLQRAFEVDVPPGHPSGRTSPIGPPNQAHLAGASFFDELATAFEVDQPASWHPAPPRALEAILSANHGMGEDELSRAVELGEGRLTGHRLANDATGNGWGTRLSGSDFGQDVMARAAAAKYVLAGHHPAENRTYVAERASDGGHLDGNRALILRFPPGGEPPCNGFWSLTVYDPDMFLVPNEIDRYSIGDRTPGLRGDQDGGLTIVVGGPAPDDKSNWLPAPAGPYRLGLRVYEGGEEVVDGEWFPPPLVPQVGE
jgi:hypothetical protein